MLKKQTLTTLTLTLIILFPVLGQDTALDIIRRADELQIQAETAKAEMSMLIYANASNDKNVREMKILSYSRGEEDSYMVFEEPRSIKGLSILSLSGDQWIFFPSTGRVRKIAERSKDQSIQGVGGDFSYEDLGGGNFEEKYEFEIERDTRKIWILTGIPREEKPVYSKIEITIRKNDYQITNVEYYTERDGHQKSLVMDEIRSIGGRDMPTRITMTNLLKNTKTVIITLDAEYDIPIDDKYFNPSRFYR